MKFLLQYLKSHGRVCLGFLICAGLYGLIAWAYGIPMEAVGYTAFLCLGVLVILGSVDLLRSWNRYKILEQLKEREILTVDMLPDPRSDLEERYQELLTEILHRKMKGEARRDQKLSELIEYYTLWVHQIKTPIAAMRLLLQKPGQEQDPELSEQLFRIEEYVNMVLQYLRVDGDNDLVVQWNDLDLMVRQAVHRYAGMFIRKKLSLSYEPLNRKVLTDEKWLVFVVEQILSNAVKYTGQGGISIYLEPGPDTVLAIRDTGTGIALEDQPRIFEKGFTGYNGHADKRSTGIGLYLCRRILNRLSHEITVESEPGKGTIMRIWFAKERLEVE